MSPFTCAILFAATSAALAGKSTLLKWCLSQRAGLETEVLDVAFFSGSRRLKEDFSI